MTRSFLLLLVLFAPVAAAAQPGPVASGEPGESPTMVRAAGMPLNDGGLPPGMLTVRVVQGAFTNNLAGQVVEVQVTGRAIERAMTGPDGRAQFAHLLPGAEVRAVTTVGNEALTSDTFVMPSDSGVRLLLVAGGDSGGAIASGPADTTVATPAPASRLAVAQPVAPAQDQESGVLAIRVALALTTVFVFVLFTVQRRPRRS